MMELKERVKKTLSGIKKKVIRDSKLTPSAVLLIFYKKGQDYHILFTQRTFKVEHHKGQISFPGGVYQEEDKTLKVTALREGYEEIGVRQEDVEILGELDDYATPSNFLISPFVATIPYPYEFRPNPEEIERIIEIPIPALLDKEIFRKEYWDRQGELVSMYFYKYGKEIIWGATAKILTQFLTLIFDFNA